MSATVDPGAKVVIVTGGASGIGQAACARFRSAPSEYALAVFDLDGTGASQSAGSDGLGVAVDVTDPTSVEKACALVLEQFGRIDVLVNNAGITGSQEAAACHVTPLHEWEQVIAVNVRGPFLCTRAVLPAMMAQGNGHIITMASIGGMVGFPDRCAYLTSKGAALMFARSLAVDYARYGIRSNAICPGMALTPMSQWRLEIPELRQAVESFIPMGRTATADEIADAIVVLASGRMAYMNGAALVIDGGWTSR